MGGQLCVCVVVVGEGCPKRREQKRGKAQLSSQSVLLVTRETSYRAAAAAAAEVVVANLSFLPQQQSICIA